MCSEPEKYPYTHLYKFLVYVNNWMKATQGNNETKSQLKQQHALVNSTMCI